MGKQCADPLAGILAGVVRELFRRHQPGRQVEVPGDREPVFKLGGFLLLAGRVEAAALAVAHVFTDILGKAPPDLEAFQHHWHFTGVTALDANPAPVPPGLLAGDMALFAKRHPHAATGEEPGG